MDIAEFLRREVLQAFLEREFITESLAENILTCPRCGIEMKIISFITEIKPIRKILALLKEKGIDTRAGPFTGSAA